MAQELEPGDIVYFRRESKYKLQNGSIKEAPVSSEVAWTSSFSGSRRAHSRFKGQLTTCSREHLRRASSVEQISAEEWHDAIQECVEAALHDHQRLAAPATPAQVPPTPGRQSLPNVPEQAEILPPVEPTELISALSGEPELPGSGSLSRRASTMSCKGIRIILERGPSTCLNPAGQPGQSSTTHTAFECMA